MRKFDLNIEKILENWKIHHAIRELIANALDEQLLANTKEVEIVKEDDIWIIRDYGRGLNYYHLTQNENDEKLANDQVIGRFGVGLKDALATLNRNNIPITLSSKYGEISLTNVSKEGFEDVHTLHALIGEPRDKNFVGTKISLLKVKDQTIEKAKKLFLRFSGETIIEDTPKGQIVRKNGRFANIYINGVKVAEEENFLFSYNITVTNAAIKKALNREKANVGRSAYTDTVKKLLLSAESNEVAIALGDDLERLIKGTSGDEIQWIDVQEHAVRILNQHGNYLFVTPSDERDHPDMIDKARGNGLTIITITEKLSAKIKGGHDFLGKPIVGFEQFVKNYHNSFEYNFIAYDELKAYEKEVFDFLPQILEIFGGKPRVVKAIKISSTMQVDLMGNGQTVGCWDSSSNQIVISRRQLSSITDFAGTMIHELIHAKTGCKDVTREFERQLTKCIGRISAMLIAKMQYVN